MDIVELIFHICNCFPFIVFFVLSFLHFPIFNCFSSLALNILYNFIHFTFFKKINVLFGFTCFITLKYLFNNIVFGRYCSYLITECFQILPPHHMSLLSLISFVCYKHPAHCYCD